MKVELTKQECKWLVELADRAKLDAINNLEQTPNRLFALRRDNMSDLETKLRLALEKQILKEKTIRSER